MTAVSSFSYPVRFSHKTRHHHHHHQQQHHHHQNPPKINLVGQVSLKDAKLIIRDISKRHGLTGLTFHQMFCQHAGLREVLPSQSLTTLWSTNIASWKINILNPKMEVDGRWGSLSIGWLSSSTLLFRGGVGPRMKMVVPIEHGKHPASYVRLLEGRCSKTCLFSSFWVVKKLVPQASSCLQWKLGVWAKTNNALGYK